jgi:hypothetical protein
MYARRFTIALFALFVIALIACGQTPEPEPTTAPPPTVDPNVVMAQELWQELQSANYVDSWETIPGKGTMYKGQGPHGTLLSTYLNPEAAGAMQSASGDMPASAIILKENYMADETLAALTVMYKVVGYDPARNDWFYVKYQADGTIDAAGTPGGCLSCHGAVRSNDYIFSFPLNLMQVDATEPTDDDTALADELWQKMQDANYEENWVTIPGKETFYKGQGPHGALLSTYLNQEAAEAMITQPGEMTAGAIVVKNNYMPDKTLAAITVMYKSSGYDAEHNDWFYVRYQPDGTVDAVGKPVGCLSCHGAVESNDYIFSFPVTLMQP